MKNLDLNETVYNATKKYPELIKIIADMGFPQIRNNFMLSTLGKRYSLKEAINFAHLDQSKAVEVLTANGFNVIN